MGFYLLEAPVYLNRNRDPDIYIQLTLMLMCVHYLLRFSFYIIVVTPGFSAYGSLM